MGPISAETEIDVPRERVFEAIADLALRPAFTDHFLSDFHLTRIESTGVGAGARFRVEAPLRKVWMDTTIVELEDALPDRRARPGRPRQPHPQPHGLGADRGAGLADHGAGLPLDRARSPIDRGLELLSTGSVWQERGWREALKRLRDGLESGDLGGRADRRRRRQPLRDRHPVEAPNRLSPPMFPNRRLVLPLLAALALAGLVVGVSACGYESHEKDVVEGEPVELGELSFNVTFSRYLNPADNEDSAYLVGQKPPPEGSTYFGVFFEIQNESEEPQTLPSTLKITDADHNTLRGAAQRKPLRARVRRRSRIAGTDPGARLDRRSWARSRARWRSSCCRPRPPTRGR